MTVGQKASLSLLVAVLVFAAFAVAAFSGLFHVVEAKFYNPSVARSWQKALDASAEASDTWHGLNLDRFKAVLTSDPVRRSFLPNTSAEDAFKRSNAFGKLQEETPGLVGLRLVDTAGKRIHYSTLAQDILKQSPTETLYRNYGDASDSPYESIAAPENSPGRVILDPVLGRFVYSLPFTDGFGVYRGTAFFFVSQAGLVSSLLRAGLVGVGDDAVLAGSRGVVLKPPLPGRDILLSHIAELWQAGLSQGPLPLTEGEGSGLVLFSTSTARGGYLGIVVPQSAFIFPSSMKWLLLSAFFITAYLLAFLLFNLRQDRMTVLSDRIKRFQINLLEGYLTNKADIDFERWSRELEARRGEVKDEFKRSLGRRKKGGDGEVDELIDKSWDEILAILGKRAGGEALPSGGSVREVERLIAAALKSGSFVIPAQGLVAAAPGNPAVAVPAPASSGPVQAGLPASAFRSEPPGAEAPVELGEVEEFEDFEDAEAADAAEDAVEEAESIEEFEELEEAEDAEPAPSAETSAPVSVQEVEELEELEEVEDSEAVEALEAVEEAQEAQEAEAVEEAELEEELAAASLPVTVAPEAGPQVPAEELEELEELEAVEDLEGEESTEAEAPIAATPLPRQDRFQARPSRAEAVEAGKTEELEEVEELEELEELETLEGFEGEESLGEEIPAYGDLRAAAAQALALASDDDDVPLIPESSGLELADEADIGDLIGFVEADEGEKGGYLDLVGPEEVPGGTEEAVGELEEVGDLEDIAEVEDLDELDDLGSLEEPARARKPSPVGVPEVMDDIPETGKPIHLVPEAVHEGDSLLDLDLGSLDLSSLEAWEDGPAGASEIDATRDTSPVYEADLGEPVSPPSTPSAEAAQAIPEEIPLVSPEASEILEALPEAEADPSKLDTEASDVEELIGTFIPYRRPLGGAPAFSFMAAVEELPAFDDPSEGLSGDDFQGEAEADYEEEEPLVAEGGPIVFRNGVFFLEGSLEGEEGGAILNPELKGLIDSVLGKPTDDLPPLDEAPGLD